MAGAVVEAERVIREALEAWDRAVPAGADELPVYLWREHVRFEDEDRQRRADWRPDNRLRDCLAERYRGDLMRRARSGDSVSFDALKLIAANGAKNLPPDVAEWLRDECLLDDPPRRRRGPVPVKGRRNHALTRAVERLAGERQKVTRGISAGDRCTLAGGSACDAAGLAWERVTGNLVSYKTVEGVYSNNRDKTHLYQFVLRERAASK